MLDKLGVSGVVGVLLALGGVAVVAAGIVLVLAGLALVARSVAKSVMGVFGL